MWIAITLFIILVILYFATYPYKARLNRKLKRVLSFDETDEIKNIDMEYKCDIEKDLIIQTKILNNSKCIGENLTYTLIENKNISGELPTLLLLHGLRDSSTDWLTRAHICETYLTLLKNKKIEPMNIVLINSGFDGMSWYSNFADEFRYKYEDYIIYELMPILKEKYPNSTFGICGFSMGGYGAYKLGLKYPKMFKVIGSFSGAVSIIRMSVNRRVIRLFKYLYIPKMLFSSEDKTQFLRVFSPWGYRILQQDPYTLIKEIGSKNLKDNYFYASVGREDYENHLMLQQWIDVVGRMKKNNLHFKANLCQDETHTWEYVSRDLKNFLIYFSENINRN